MKIGDRVRITGGGNAFNNKVGVIKTSMLPDYQWAVEVEGMSSLAYEDFYGFNESEMQVIPCR